MKLFIGVQRLSIEVILFKKTLCIRQLLETTCFFNSLANSKVGLFYDTFSKIPTSVGGIPQNVQRKGL
jgi:hypothetical protein